MDKELSPKKKTILVGISGGIDSLIAAYVLKRQGYNVIGVGILFAPGEEDESFKGVYLIENIGKVKSLCKKINVPFYAVNAQDLYKVEVTDHIVSSRIGGYHFCPILAATNVIIKVLYSKMSTLNAHKIATGHYARIIYNYSNNSHEIYVSKDKENDQSHFLAFLPREVLKVLEFPLSGMRREEVNKISEALHLEASEKMNSVPLNETPELIPLVEQGSAPALREEGNVINYISESILGEHSGVHFFYLGQEFGSEKVKTRDGVTLDKNFIPVYISNRLRTVVVMDKNLWVPITLIILFQCHYSEKMDISRANSGCLEINGDKEKIFINIYYLNNGNILCELKDKCKKRIFIRDSAVIYDSSGEKVILGGVVYKAGHLNKKGQFSTLPSNTWDDDDGDDGQKSKSTSKGIYSFKF